jgi:hypothetical protein
MIAQEDPKGATGAQSEAKQQKPSIGRVVQFQEAQPGPEAKPPVTRAAIITAVHDGESVDLYVLPVHEGMPYTVGRARLSEKPKAGRWNWPARAVE